MAVLALEAYQYRADFAALDRYLDRLEEMHREVIAESAARPIDTDVLLSRMGQATRALATAQDAQNEVEWANAAGARELELRAEFHARAIAREAELRAELQHRADVREAELRAEFQIQASKREAEFQAYRDWVAPRNIGRRIMHKVRRVLSRT